MGNTQGMDDCLSCSGTWPFDQWKKRGGLDYKYTAVRRFGVFHYNGNDCSAGKVHMKKPPTTVRLDIHLVQGLKRLAWRLSLEQDKKITWIDLLERAAISVLAAEQESGHTGKEAPQ